MQRRTLLKVAGVGAVGALAGCVSARGSTDDDETVSVENLQVEETDRATITVGGTGVVEADPDMATLSVSIEAHDSDDADVVVEELAERSDELIAALTDAGLSEDDITTERYSLRKHSRNNRYEGEHRYAVTVDEPDDVGEIVDVAADAGADDIGRIDFGLTEETREELYDEAVERAVEDARAEAERYTTAADRSLGDVVSIDVSDRGVSPLSRSFTLEMADADDAEPATELQQGEASVTARATIEYEID